MNEQPASSRTSKTRVLIVDDHPTLAATLARAVSQLGTDLEIMEATSGCMALDKVRDNGVDLLITDMMMPGMNGFELIERLQAHPGGRPTHIILMTAYDVPGLKETARRLKVHDILIKPVPPERIRQIVKEVLDSLARVKPTTTTVENPGRFKIMIADDLPDNITLLARYMKNEGYNYITASNGNEVLQKARRETPDLILLDVNMPEKDGFTALKELRADAQIRHIPVIFLTAARPNPDDIQSGLSLGADDYITKPFDKRELFARIGTKLRVKSAEDLTRRRNRELSVLPEIARELSARPDITELLEVALRRSVETLGAAAGHILLFGRGGPLHKEYRISTSNTPSSDSPMPPLNALFQRISETRESLLVEDTRRNPLWEDAPNNPGHSVVIVPMTGRQDLLGLFLLIHEQPGYFTPDHQVLLQAIASQVSIAVENARLYMDLAQEGRKLTAVLRNVADAILMFDADGCLSLLNPTAEKLFTEYQAKPGLPFARNRGYDTLIEALEEALASGNAKAQEILWPDRRVFTALFTPIETEGCVVLLHDVSRFKALERVKDEFIATASHDLRNPLTSIKGYSQLLLQGHGLSDMQVDFVRRIQHASDNMAELVANMLDLAKMDLNAESKFEAVDMAELLVQIADEFKPQAKAKEQKLTLEAGQGKFEVRGDSLKLRQVLRNLVGNAIKYTPINGTVNLSVTSEQYTVLVDVRDTGYGIPAEDLPHIFDRFYRVRSDAVKDIEGNGLGLAIVKSVIEAHGGQISVESKPGKGSCFTCTLPLMQQESTPDVDHDLSQPDPALISGS